MESIWNGISILHQIFSLQFSEIYNQLSVIYFVFSFQAADAWGIECLRYEIRDIRMPHRVQEAMQMQVGKSNIETLILFSSISLFSVVWLFKCLLNYLIHFLGWSREEKTCRYFRIRRYQVRRNKCCRRKEAVKNLGIG